jgi:hypothetical protein
VRNMPQSGTNWVNFCPRRILWKRSWLTPPPSTRSGSRKR